MREENIIFFDSQCALCARFVNFVFKRDKKKQLLYAPLRGATARRHLNREDIEGLKSIVFSREGEIFKSAPAIQAIMKQLYPRWSPLLSALHLGAFNFFYKIISKKRYALFGKKEPFQPSEEQKKRFLP